MSIHKSKGLEFPVVFLCNTAKQFNKQDLNDTILIHPDLGFGPKYRNRSMNIECPTLAREAMKLQLEKEMISEEMRILYVALTRAKEKMIITGTSKDWSKLCREKEEMLSLYPQKQQNKVQARLLKKYTSYLDWFTLLLKKEPMQKKIEVQVHKLEKNNKKEEQKKSGKVQNAYADKTCVETIKKLLPYGN